MTEIHLHVHLHGDDTVTVAPPERPADVDGDYKNADQQYQAGWTQAISDATQKMAEVASYRPDELCTFARVALGMVLPESHTATAADLIHRMAEHTRRYYGLEPLPPRTPDNPTTHHVSPSDATTTIIPRIEDGDHQ